MLRPIHKIKSIASLIQQVSTEQMTIAKKKNYEIIESNWHVDDKEYRSRRYQLHYPYHT